MARKKYSRYEQVMTALGGDLSNEKLKDILWTKKGTPRKHYTKAQYEAVFEELSYQFQQERERQSIARVIIDNFLDMSTWVKADNEGRLEKKVKDWVNSVKAESPNGEAILAHGLELAAQYDLVQTAKIHAYHWDVQFYLGDIMPFVIEAARDIGENSSFAEAKQLAKKFDEDKSEIEDYEDFVDDDNILEIFNE